MEGDLWEDLADSGVALHCSAVLLQLHKYDLHGRVTRNKAPLNPQQNIQL